jgi:hypothetical protein
LKFLFSEFSEDDFSELHVLVSRVHELAVDLYERGRSRDSADKALLVVEALSDFEALLLLKSAEQSDWPGYCQKILARGKDQSIEDRFVLLDIVQGRFDLGKRFSEFDKATRYLIAGRNTQDVFAEFGVDCGLFGAMGGAGGFMGVVNREPQYLDDFFSAIPAEGNISKEQYLGIVSIYRASMLEAEVDRDFFRPFTRLLAMKRPDVFICITGRNEKLLQASLNLRPLTTADYERYWDEYLFGIHEMPWYASDEPADDRDKCVWRARVALMDVLFYQSPEQAVLSKALKAFKKESEVGIDQDTATLLMSDYWQKHKADYPKNFSERDAVIQAILFLYPPMNAAGFEQEEIVARAFEAAMMVHNKEPQEAVDSWLAEQVENL